MLGLISHGLKLEINMEERYCKLRTWFHAFKHSAD